MTPRTARQAALLDSRSAWEWWLAGYERGVQAGHDAGAQSVVDDLKAAGRELAEWMPAVRREIDTRAHRARVGAV